MPFSNKTHASTNLPLVFSPSHALSFLFLFLLRAFFFHKWTVLVTTARLCWLLSSHCLSATIKQPESPFVSLKFIIFVTSLIHMTCILELEEECQIIFYSHSLFDKNYEFNLYYLLLDWYYVILRELASVLIRTSSIKW